MWSRAWNLGRHLHCTDSTYFRSISSVNCHINLIYIYIISWVTTGIYFINASCHALLVLYSFRFRDDDCMCFQILTTIINRFVLIYNSLKLIATLLIVSNSLQHSCYMAYSWKCAAQANKVRNNDLFHFLFCRVHLK